MAEETTLSTAECIAAMDALLARAAVANAEPYRARKRGAAANADYRGSRRGRRQTVATRRKLKEKQRVYHAAKALQAGNLEDVPFVVELRDGGPGVIS